MKLKIFPLLICLLPTISFAQFQSSIDFIGSVAYSYRNLTTTSTTPIVVEILKKREDTEVGKLNWRVGFNYNQQLFKRIHLKSGIRLASVGFKGENRTGLMWASEHDGMGGFIPNPNLIHEMQHIPDFWFLELPIVGRFEFTDKQLTPFVELGISPTIYLTTRNQFITDINETINFQRANDFNQLQLVGSASFGLNYTLNEQLQLFGQPIFRYHLTKSRDRPIEERLFSYGLEMGIRKKIN